MNVVSSPNPSTLAESVTFTATVTTVGPGGTPTGTVTFKERSLELGTGPLNGSGVASFTTAALRGGTHVITATYGGDTNHTTAFGMVDQLRHGHRDPGR